MLIFVAHKPHKPDGEAPGFRPKPRYAHYHNDCAICRGYSIGNDMLRVWLWLAGIAILSLGLFLVLRAANLWHPVAHILVTYGSVALIVGLGGGVCFLFVNIILFSIIDGLTPGGDDF